MTAKTRKNLGMLLLALVVAAVGLLAMQTYAPVGSLILLFAGIVAAVSVVEIGLDLMRDDAPPAESD